MQISDKNVGNYRKKKTARLVGQSVTPAICPEFEAVRNLQYFNNLGLDATAIVLGNHESSKFKSDFLIWELAEKIKAWIENKQSFSVINGATKRAYIESCELVDVLCEKIISGR